MCQAVGRSIEIGLLATLRCHRARHPGGVRAGPAPVRGPLEHQRADLPADGGARDRDGLLPAGAVRGHRLRGPAGLRDDPDRPHHVLPVVRGGDRAGARLAGLSDTLEQAAMDLYATPNQTFWRVTFPLVFPGILGAALLAFSLSFDDFIITNLNAGTTTTFPMYVWGVSAQVDPDADQRRRHGDAGHLDADRGRWRDAQPAPACARSRRPPRRATRLDRRRCRRPV